MTGTETPIESILAIDCGNTLTRALLVDQVEGQYRLISRAEVPSTFGSPWHDLMVSVRQAIDQISNVTGWPLLPEGGQIIMRQGQEAGVDTVVTTTSASEPLRVVLTGLSDKVSLASARRGLPLPCAVVEGAISSNRRDGAVCIDDFEGQVCLFHDVVPDAIVMVGGVDGGATEPLLQSARAVAWAYSTLPSLQASPPAVVYAGNAELQGRVSRLLGSDVQFHAVGNVRPSLELENPGPLQTVIEELHRQHKIEQLPGFGTLASWSSVPVRTTAMAFAHAVQYMAGLDQTNVLGVDVGGAAVTMATVIDGQFDMALRSDLGLSHNVARILDCVPVEAVLRWLPFELDASEARNALHNKALRPHTLPQTRQDLLLEQAVAREILRLTVADAVTCWPNHRWQPRAGLPAKFHLILGSGGVLANAPNCGQAALILLDALQPVGISGLALDRFGLVALSAAVATVNPFAAAQLMGQDALLKLGTVVATVGTAPDGEPALTCRIVYEDGRSLEAEVTYGSLKVVPLPAGEQAELELRPARHFDVGLGTRGQPGITRVEGGTLGIIIDARGRPLPLAEDPHRQQERVKHWLWDLGA